MDSPFADFANPNRWLALRATEPAQWTGDAQWKRTSHPHDICHPSWADTWQWWAACVSL